MPGPQRANPPASPRPTRRLPRGASPATGGASSRSAPRLSPRRLRCASGQAAVEFVALLPALVAVVAVAWQTLLAGQAVWEARVAARAAARAHAFGADATAAARSHLRPRLERGLRVRSDADGEVRVSVRIPAVIPSVRLGRVSARSHFRPQGS